MATSKSTQKLALFKPKSIADLKADTRNPRTISSRELKKLDESINRWGDLSGIVFNVHTQQLISGHQRMKTLKGRPSKLHRIEQPKDKYGTVATGYVMYKGAKGDTIKIPYREVNWSSKEEQWAANIAANASGGSFDQSKLGAILADLKKSSFDIEATNLDQWDANMALRRAGVDKLTGANKKGGKGEVADSGGSDMPAVHSPKGATFAHECPKCGFRWNAAKQQKGGTTDSLPSEKTLRKRLAAQSAANKPAAKTQTRTTRRGAK